MNAGICSEDVIRGSISWVDLYAKLNTEKMDISRITTEQVSEKIMAAAEKA